MAMLNNKHSTPHRVVVTFYKQLIRSVNLSEFNLNYELQVIVGIRGAFRHDMID